MAKPLNELRERFGQTVQAAETIQTTAETEGRELSPEERTQVQALLDEHDKLGVEIKLAERMESAKAEVAATKRISEPQAPERPEMSVRKIEFPRGSYGSLRAFRPRRGETSREAEERAYRSGMFYAAVIYGNQRAKLWCADHGIELRAQVEGVNTYGGSLVPDEVEATIIDLKESYGVVRQNAKVQRMTRDHMVIPRRVTGLTAYAIGEGDSITESTKTWDQVELTARKWGALAKVSSELAEDAIINVADDLTAEIAYAFANKEDDCGFNGTGTSTYNGIVGILTKMLDGSHAGSYYTAEGGANTIDTWAEITATTLAGTMGKLPGYVYQKGAPKWFCPIGGYANIFERLAMAAGGNNRVTISTAGVVSREYNGFPVVEVAAWATSADYSAILMCLFGDMGMACTLGDRRGVTVKVDASRFIDYDQLAVVGTTRFDFNVHDVGGASTAGPLIGLLGN